MSQSILNEYDNIYREYSDIYDIYKGKMNKDEKLRRYRAIEVNKYMLENNRTEINTAEKETIMNYVFAFIAAMVGIGTICGDKSGSLEVTLFLLILIILFLIMTLYLIRKIDRNAKINAKTRNDEEERIRKMYLTKEVLKDLLLEEDGFSL